MSERVSVLMPMRNAEAYLKASINSILKQTYTHLELIIIDDCSTDSSRKIVESFSDSRIKLIQGEGKGISAALNLAIDKAQGKYICRCDADDLFPSDRLFTQVRWLEAHPDYIAIAGKFSSMDEKSNIIAEFQTGDDECDITPELLNGKTRTHLGTFLIKKAALVKSQGFREYFITAEDIDMQLRLAEYGLVGYLPQNMYFYRIHNSSITHLQHSNKRVFYEAQAREYLMQRQKDGKDQLQLGQPLSPPSGQDKPSNSSDQILGYLIGESWRLHTAKQKKEALLVAMRACTKYRFHWLAWKNIIIIILKK